MKIESTWILGLGAIVVMTVLAASPVKPEPAAVSVTADNLWGRRIEVGHSHWLFEPGKENLNVRVLNESRTGRYEAYLAVHVKSVSSTEMLKGVCLLRYIWIDDTWYLDTLSNSSLEVLEIEAKPE